MRNDCEDGWGSVKGGRCGWKEWPKEREVLPLQHNAAPHRKTGVEYVMCTSEARSPLQHVTATLKRFFFVHGGYYYGYYY